MLTMTRSDTSSATPAYAALTPCELDLEDRLVAGFLYLQTDRIVVLLGTVTASADLGPLKTCRTHHIEPECSVFVYPRTAVRAIRRFVAHG